MARAAPASGTPPTAPATAAGRSALLVFAPVDERSLASLKGMSVGILSAAEGGPSAAQLRLDITQGARLASGSYGSPPAIPAAAHIGVGGADRGLGRPSSRGPAAHRANCGPGCSPRRSAAAAYLAAARGGGPDATVAADGAGRVAAVSQGAPATLVARADRLLGRRPLVVATIRRAGSQGRRALQQLAAARGSPGADDRGAERPRLAPLPTAVGWSRGPRRAPVRGADLQRHRAAGDDLQHRHRAHDPRPRAGGDSRVGPGKPGAGRRAPGRGGAAEHDRATGRDRRAAPVRRCWRCWPPGGCCWRPARAPPAARRRALRIGALGVLWAPLVALLTAALAPAAVAEYALLVLGCGALGALSDRLGGLAARAAGAGRRLHGGDRRRRAGGQPAADALAARPRPRARSPLSRHRQRPQVGAGGARSGRRGRRPVPVLQRTGGRGRRWRWRAQLWPAWRAPPASERASEGVVIVCVAFALAVATLLARGTGATARGDRGAEPDRGADRAGAHRPRERPRQRALLRQRPARTLRRRAARSDRPPLRSRLARAPPRGDAGWPRCSRSPPGPRRCGCAHACWRPSGRTRRGGRPSTGRWRPGSWVRWSRTPARCCSSPPCSPAGACSATCGAARARRGTRTRGGAPSQREPRRQSSSGRLLRTSRITATITSTTIRTPPTM